MNLVIGQDFITSRFIADDVLHAMYLNACENAWELNEGGYLPRESDINYQALMEVFDVMYDVYITGKELTQEEEDLIDEIPLPFYRYDAAELHEREEEFFDSYADYLSYNNSTACLLVDGDEMRTSNFLHDIVERLRYKGYTFRTDYDYSAEKRFEINNQPQMGCW